LSEGRAVAGAAQSGGESNSEPTPARWLDQPQHTVRTEVLPAWLPGTTRHQQLDTWLAAEAYHDRGPREQVAVRLLERKFELLGASELLETEQSVRQLVQLEGQTSARPTVLSALNSLARDLHDSATEAAESTTSETAEDCDVGEAFDELGDGDDPYKPPSETRSAVAADGGDDPAECPECGLERVPDQIGDQSLWYCKACEELSEREVEADVGVTA
jgi:hypothetical protein